MRRVGDLPDLRINVGRWLPAHLPLPDSLTCLEKSHYWQPQTPLGLRQACQVRFALLSHQDVPIHTLPLMTAPAPPWLPQNETTPHLLAGLSFGRVGDEGLEPPTSRM
jgi:hypothetical protein